MSESEALQKFKDKHALWKACLSGNDRNSVFNQIYAMVWNAAVFNVINEARRLASIDNQEQAEMNGMVHQFIDNCFFDSQMVAIRRLVDVPSQLEHSSQGTFSLVALLKDMIANASLITRENLFLVDGLEYDYGVVERKADAYRLEKGGSGVYWLPKELDSHSIRIRHEQIDALCGVFPDQRSPRNVVLVDSISYLKKKIESASADIVLHVDKFIAHSASPGSRSIRNADDLTITLGSLWNAHKVICQVANLVDLLLVSRTAHSFLAVPQYNNFEFIDRPIVGKEDIDVLDKAWQTFQKETEEWALWGLKDLQNEMIKI